MYICIFEHMFKIDGGTDRREKKNIHLIEKCSIFDAIRSNSRSMVLICSFQ